jgi:hypothetical protein
MGTQQPNHLHAGDWPVAAVSSLSITLCFFLELSFYGSLAFFFQCFHSTRAQGRFYPQDEESSTTMKHHFKVDVFAAAIDFQLKELNNRFREHVMKLLILSTALSLKDAYKSFKIDDICNLVEKFNP